AQQDTIAEARRLAEAVRNGDLSASSDAVRTVVLAWCARFLSQPATSEAEELLQAAGSGSTELELIARALIDGAGPALPKALGTLAALGTPIAMGAAFILVLRTNGLDGGLEWLEKSSLTPNGLDSDAKFFHLQAVVDAGRWSEALDAVNELKE